MTNLASLAVVLAAFSTSAMAADRPRAVVELFTSQGCSSCPPADRLAGELARDPNLVVLSYNVTYWDYLGWRDTLGLPANTARQRAYAETRGDRQVYTPQVVVDGVFHAVGSDRSEISAEAARTGSGPAAAALSVPVSLTRNGGKIDVTIGASASPTTAGRVLLVTFEPEHQVKIGAGENTGSIVTYYNVVRSVRDCGAFTGQAENLILDAPSDRGLGAAVLVQAGDPQRNPGVILGAAQLR